MKKFTKIAASAAAAVLLTATAVPVVPTYAETYQVEYEALAGKISVSKLTIGKIADQTYTGNTITWDEISAAALDYLPEKLELGKMDMSKYTVPVPGTEK